MALPITYQYHLPSPLTSIRKLNMFIFTRSCKIISCFFFVAVQIFIINILFYSQNPFSAFNKLPNCDTEIAPFYIYDLPYRFNGLIQRNCSKMHRCIDMCPQVVNHGFGLPSRRPNWYNTNQFTLELIFHARARNHPCRTHDPKSARLFFIPFYVGFYSTSHDVYYAKNNTVRDVMAFDLVDYLSNISYFHHRGGHDHFIVGGGNVKEINRPKNYHGEFPATRLISLPEFSNVTTLVIERDPDNLNGTVFGIPFASYFHPNTSSEMIAWQDEIRRSERNHLFSFIGGGRDGKSDMAILRSKLLKQCRSTKRCLLFDCGENALLCELDSDWVMNVMKRSQFCLQPPGDGWTRRSVFDSVLAACIPVFFSENTAYVQYPWHLPKKREDWSVFIERDQVDQIEQVLGNVSAHKVERMRRVLIDMIPHVTYVDPNATHIGFRDAVDVTLIELTKRVNATFNSL